MLIKTCSFLTAANEQSFLVFEVKIIISLYCTAICNSSKITKLLLIQDYINILNMLEWFEMLEKKNEIVKEIINKLAKETAQFKLQWDSYESEALDAWIEFEFKKKSLRKDYKKFKIDSIKQNKSIFTKITNGNNGDTRISIIKCKLANEDVLNDEEKTNNKYIYLLICDFEESENFEKIAESESFPEIADLYDLALFIGSTEIRSVINYFREIN
jgi:hypothetical protein